MQGIVACIRIFRVGGICRPLVCCGRALLGRSLRPGSDDLDEASLLSRFPWPLQGLSSQGLPRNISTAPALPPALPSPGQARPESSTIYISVQPRSNLVQLSVCWARVGPSRAHQDDHRLQYRTPESSRGCYTSTVRDMSCVAVRVRVPCIIVIHKIRWRDLGLLGHHQLVANCGTDVIMI